MGTLERKKFSMTCGIYLFLIYEEFRVCQEFFIVLLTSFFSLSVAGGPLVSCPGVLRIYSLVVFFFISGSYISAPLGSIEGESRAGLPWRECFIRSRQMESWRQAFLVLITGFLWLLGPGSGAGGIWACLWTTVSSTLRNAWFFL